MVCGQCFSSLFLMKSPSIWYLLYIYFQLIAIATVITIVFEETRSWFHSHHRIAGGIRSLADLVKRQMFEIVEMTGMVRVEMPKFVSMFNGFSMVSVSLHGTNSWDSLEEASNIVFGPSSFMQVQEDAESHVCFWPLLTLEPSNIPSFSRCLLYTTYFVWHPYLTLFCLYAFRLTGCCWGVTWSWGSQKYLHDAWWWEEQESRWCNSDGAWFAMAPY